MQFKCKTLTPLFLGGPSRNEIEFRPPAIKSSLRYWWRALNAHLTIDKMVESETNIFGFGGENALASSFKINNFSSNDKMDYYPKLPREDSYKSLAFSPENHFQIELNLKVKSEFNAEHLIALMQIASSLGNLGNRARRGMGAWQINEINCGKDTKIDFNLQTLYEKIKLFSSHYVISSDFKGIELKDTFVPETPDYPFIKKIYFDDCEKIEINSFLKKILKVSHDFKRDFVEKYSVNIGSERQRLASPVYISIVEVNGCFYPIITRLNNPGETDNELVEKYIAKILE